MSELRIVDEELWQQVKLRAEFAKQFEATTKGVRAARAERLNHLRRSAFLLSVPLAGLLVEVLVVECEHGVRRSAQGKAELLVVAVGLALLACHEVLFSNEDGHKFPFSILTDLPGFGDLPRLTGRPESRGGG